MIKVTLEPEFEAKIPSDVKGKIELLSEALVRKEVITYLDDTAGKFGAAISVLKIEGLSVELASSSLLATNASEIYAAKSRCLVKAKESLKALLTFKEVVNDIRIEPQSPDAAMALTMAMLSKMFTGNCGNPECRSCNG